MSERSDLYFQKMTQHVCTQHVPKESPIWADSVNTWNSCCLQLYETCSQVVMSSWSRIRRTANTGLFHYLNLEESNLMISNSQHVIRKLAPETYINCIQGLGYRPQGIVLKIAPPLLAIIDKQTTTSTGYLLTSSLPAESRTCEMCGRIWCKRRVVHLDMVTRKRIPKASR